MIQPGNKVKSPFKTMDEARNEHEGRIDAVSRDQLIEVSDMRQSSPDYEPSLMIAPQPNNATTEQLQCTFSKRNSLSPIHESTVGGHGQPHGTVSSFANDHSTDQKRSPLRETYL